jgi:hypothetical protein
MTTTKNKWCYYSVHFGCLCSERDPSCNRCAERLTNAVMYTAQHGPRDVSRDYEEQGNHAHTRERELTAELREG